VLWTTLRSQWPLLLFKEMSITKFLMPLIHLLSKNITFSVRLLIFKNVFTGVIPKLQQNFMMARFYNYFVSVIFRRLAFLAISTKINGNARKRRHRRNMRCWAGFFTFIISFFSKRYMMTNCGFLQCAGFRECAYLKAI
jgi:hypothetical protein